MSAILRPKRSNFTFKFLPFLKSEYDLTTDPERPICQFYDGRNINSCPNGLNCENKHVSSMFSNKVVCKHWLRGLCKKNDNCEFLHEYNLRKMPECLFFTKNGFCTQGNECLYRHINPQLKIPECQDFNLGFCRYGPQCPRRHVKREICPLYLFGFCPAGRECDNVHPKFNVSIDRLRIKSDTVRRVEDSNQNSSLEVEEQGMDIDR
ncbi:hypothetical protein BABINDRAFT_163254 [Babjeviella inositovora NRRL Y-12698]|uniref:mRNA 3'-end-processing protein n=1 Tax=Babjeviella inositovora NRRL Y-12698 TaxID=984486 RepID=A0A1E3QJL3_9ASCO|nr:uncharacterized protein BABINDRAFT_163254 [Babjeviella inositovora NRRL Y-12698]ODQ77879.1 hypothetical protein BABINDRAFT_163254 [Babjeviella inositovora NRRL Y-12698]